MFPLLAVAVSGPAAHFLTPLASFFITTLIPASFIVLGFPFLRRNPRPLASKASRKSASAPRDSPYFSCELDGDKDWDYVSSPAEEVDDPDDGGGEDTLPANDTGGGDGENAVGEGTGDGGDGCAAAFGLDGTGYTQGSSGNGSAGSDGGHLLPARQRRTRKRDCDCLRRCLCWHRREKSKHTHGSGEKASLAHTHSF